MFPDWIAHSVDQTVQESYIAGSNPTQIENFSILGVFKTFAENGSFD